MRLISFVSPVCHRVLTERCSAEFPADKVHTLSSNEHINVEDDKQVTTQ